MLQLQANFMKCLLTGKGKLSFDPSHLPIFFLLKNYYQTSPPPPLHTHTPSTPLDISVWGKQCMAGVNHSHSTFLHPSGSSQGVEGWRGGVQMLLIASWQETEDKLCRWTSPVFWAYIPDILTAHILTTRPELARIIITRARKFEHITPSLKNLESHP